MFSIFVIFKSKLKYIIMVRKLIGIISILSLTSCSVTKTPQVDKIPKTFEEAEKWFDSIHNATEISNDTIITNSKVFSFKYGL